MLTLDEVKSFVSSTQNNWQGAPRMAIVARREMDLEIGRLFKGYLRERPCGVFSEIGDAESFLTADQQGGVSHRPLKPPVRDALRGW